MIVRNRIVLAIFTAALACGPATGAGIAHADTGAPFAHADTGAGGTRSQAASASARTSTYLWFVKNAKNPSNSRLSLIYINSSNPDHPHSFTVATWRAGSGNGSKNSCKPNAGWLPDGTYKVRAFYRHHNGGAHGVNGISWLISNHRCHSGTLRTDLFIHSEMLPSGKQGRSEPYRWNGTSDYKSNGCIKLKPSDIRHLAGYRASYPKPTKLYVS